MSTQFAIDPSLSTSAPPVSPPLVFIRARRRDDGRRRLFVVACRFFRGGDGFGGDMSCVEAGGGGRDADHLVCLFFIYGRLRRVTIRMAAGRMVGSRRRRERSKGMTRPRSSSSSSQDIIRFSVLCLRYVHILSQCAVYSLWGFGVVAWVGTVSWPDVCPWRGDAYARVHGSSASAMARYDPATASAGWRRSKVGQPALSEPEHGVCTSARSPPSLPSHSRTCT